MTAVDCEHYSDVGRIGGGRCSLRGIDPSALHCERCRLRAPNGRPVPVPVRLTVAAREPRTPELVAENLAACDAPCEARADVDADDTRRKCSACQTCDGKRTAERWITLSVGRCPLGKWDV